MARTGYGQFCPVAKTAELLAERWMPLVLRELLAGSCHFSDLRRGMPLISPATLSQRLRELEDAGVLDRTRPEGRSRSVQYRLTEAGKELRPIIRAFGVWGERWAQGDFRSEKLDPGLLMWAMHRRLNLKEFPSDHAVLQFELPDVEIRLRRFWFVIDHAQVDVCLKNPGYDVDPAWCPRHRWSKRCVVAQVAPAAAPSL
jgi:DNA-binding HxlR family transcriptional regulator